MPSGKPGTRKPKPQDLRDTPAKGKPLDGSKNPGGRPEEWPDDRIEAVAERMLQWALGTPRAFYIAQFIEEEAATGTLIHKQRISEWEKGNDKFSELYKTTRCVLESHIGKNAMDGAIPPAMGVFGLKQHGHSDKIDVGHTGKVEQKHTGTITHTFDITKISDLLNGSAV